MESNGRGLSVDREHCGRCEFGAAASEGGGDDHQRRDARRGQLSGENFTSNVEKLLTRQVMGTNLPKFSGEVSQWPSFLATYLRTTIDCQFSDPENMQRLRDCLEGRARKCVNMILLTNESEGVIEKLKQNFGNMDRILSELQDEISAFSGVIDSAVFWNSRIWSRMWW
jgi:Protein of unknown function (DUF1759)